MTTRLYGKWSNLSHHRMAMRIALFLVASVLLVQRSSGTTATADQVWARALQAKQELVISFKFPNSATLNTVENLWVARYPGNSRKPALVDLYVFPNEFWSWKQESAKGTSLTINNGAGTWTRFNF